jgi:hypothetical protein
MGETGDDGLDKNPCAVGRCVDDNALVVVVPRILPLGLDANTITDFKGYGDVARDTIVAVHNGENHGII